jgi:hypothetical protein
MEAEIINTTIAYGNNRYRLDVSGNWMCLMFGTFGPDDHGVPRHAWRPIPADKVPADVKAVAAETLKRMSNG